MTLTFQPTAPSQFTGIPTNKATFPSRVLRNHADCRFKIFVFLKIFILIDKRNNCSIGSISFSGLWNNLSRLRGSYLNLTPTPNNLFINKNQPDLFGHSNRLLDLGSWFVWLTVTHPLGVMLLSPSAPMAIASPFSPRSVKLMLTCRELLDGHEWKSNKTDGSPQHLLLVPRSDWQLLPLAFCFCPADHSSKQPDLTDAQRVALQHCTQRVCEKKERKWSKPSKSLLLLHMRCITGKAGISAAASCPKNFHENHTDKFFFLNV